MSSSNTKSGSSKPRTSNHTRTSTRTTKKKQGYIVQVFSNPMKFIRDHWLCQFIIFVSLLCIFQNQLYHLLRIVELINSSVWCCCHPISCFWGYTKSGFVGGVSSAKSGVVGGVSGVMTGVLGGVSGVMSGFGWILGGLGGIGADGNTNNDYSHSNNDFTPTSTYIFKPIPSKSTSKSKPKPFSFASFSFTSSSFSQKCPPKPEPDVFTTTLQSLPPNLSLTPTITTLSQIISTLNYTIDYYYFSPSKPESGFQSTNCSPFPLFTYNLTTLTDLLSSLDITYTTHLTSYLTTLQLLSHSSRSTSSSITSDINLFKKAIGEIETAKKERRFWRKGRHIGKLHDEARVKLGNIRKTLNEYRDEMEHSVGLLAGGAEEVNNLIVGVEGMVRGISIVENKEGVRKCVKEMREKGISGVEWAEMEREIEAIYGGVVGRGLLDELLVENKWLKQMFEAQIMAWEDVMGWWYVFADDKQMGKGNSGGNKNGHGNEDVMYCGCFPSIPMEIKKIERGGEIGMSENEEDKSEIKMLFQWIEEVGRWEMGRKEFAKEMEGAVEIWLGGLRED